jgi:hypothetical protein
MYNYYIFIVDIMSITVTDSDWDLFEEHFNILRNDMVEVPNRYRHVCKLYVKKEQIDLYKIQDEELKELSKIVISEFKSTPVSIYGKPSNAKIRINELYKSISEMIYELTVDHRWSRIYNIVK